jgi:hypothetical protein
LRRIDLANMTGVDELLKFLGEHVESLRFLDELDLADSDLTDAGLAHVVEIRSLNRLNLARTRITAAGLAVLGQLSDLAWLNLAGLHLTWWDRRRLRQQLPRTEVVFK